MDGDRNIIVNGRDEVYPSITILYIFFTSGSLTRNLRFPLPDSKTFR